MAYTSLSTERSLGSTVGFIEMVHTTLFVMVSLFALMKIVPADNSCPKAETKWMVDREKLDDILKGEPSWKLVAWWKQLQLFPEGEQFMIAFPLPTFPPVAGWEGGGRG